MTQQRRRIGITIAAAFALATSVLMSAAPTEAAPGGKVSPTLFGMHVIDAELGTWPTMKIGSLRIWDNHASWSAIEKKPGQFDWSKLDAIVANAESHHTKNIMYVLAGTPQWASDRIAGGELPTLGASGVPRSFSWWDRWVSAVANRYKGRITSYQVWNEMNLRTFFTGTPKQMAEMTERAYKIIKSVDPAAEVVAASTGTRFEPAFVANYPPYLAELKKRGWPVDAFAAHFYPVSTGTPSSRAKLIDQWKSMLAKAGAPKKPLYETESNFGLAGLGFPDKDINGSKAADWVGQTYLDTLRFGLQRAYWYSWAPEGDLLGIQMHADTPGAKAFQSMETWLKGNRLSGCTTSGNVNTCTFTKGATKQSFSWASKGTAKFKAPAGTKQMCNSEGACSPAGAGTTVKSRGPVRFSS